MVDVDNLKPNFNYNTDTVRSMKARVRKSQGLPDKRSQRRREGVLERISKRTSELPHGIRSMSGWNSALLVTQCRLNLVKVYFVLNEW